MINSYDRRQGIKSAEKYLYVNSVKRAETIACFCLFTVTAILFAIAIFTSATMEVM
jgi:hypothetical protein